MIKNKKLRISDYNLQDSLLYFQIKSKFICFIGLKINITSNKLEDIIPKILHKYKTTYIYDLKQSSYLIFIRFETNFLAKAQEISNQVSEFSQLNNYQIELLKNELLYNNFFYIFQKFATTFDSMQIQSYPFKIQDKLNNKILNLSILDISIDDLNEKKKKLIQSYISNKNLQIYCISNKIISSIYDMTLLMITDSSNSIDKFREFIKSMDFNKKIKIKQIKLEILRNLIIKKPLGMIRTIKLIQYFNFLHNWSSISQSFISEKKSSDESKDQININQISQLLNNSRMKEIEKDHYSFEQEKILIVFIFELKENIILNILKNYYSEFNEIFVISEDLTYKFLTIDTKIQQLKKIHIFNLYNKEMFFSTLSSKISNEI